MLSNDDGDEAMLDLLMVSFGTPLRTAFLYHAMHFHTGPTCWKDFLFRFVVQHCRTRKQLPRPFLDALLKQGKEELEGTPNVLEISDHIDASSTLKTITVVGDIHGQLDDSLNILENPNLGDWTCTDNILIFNGDLVDRGEMSVECFSIVLLAKLLFKKRVHIVRGNHESAVMNLSYGFDLEVLEKYHDRALLQSFRDVFTRLPIAAVLEKSVFLVHGGIGPEVSKMTIAELNAIHRTMEPVQPSALWELLWSDPVISPGFRSTRSMVNNGFGPDITASFLALNNLSLLVRSHTECRKGYQFTHGGQVLTVFSAPNYMGNVVGKGAVVKFGTKPDMQPEMRVFDAVHYAVAKNLTYQFVTVQGTRYQKAVRKEKNKVLWGNKLKS